MTATDGASAPVLRVADVGSTNDDALAELRRTGGAVWLRADRQLAGRGRRGREWSSPKGNLYASFATSLPAGLDDDRFTMLPLTASVALANAIDQSSTVRPELKWPNDVLVGGEKTAGILLEAEAGPPRRVVIGFGVNVVVAPDLPAATKLTDHDPAIDIETLFAALRQTLAVSLAALFGEGGIAHTRSAWLQRAVGIGMPVTVRFERTVREGRFVGLDPSGRLILADDQGRTDLIAAGDVFIRAKDTGSEDTQSRGPL